MGWFLWTNRWALVLVVGLSVAYPAPSGAADRAEVDAARELIERLKQEQLLYQRKILELEQRLDQLEEQPPEGAYAGSQDSGSPTVDNDDRVAADGTVRESPASRSAQDVYQEQGALFGQRFSMEVGLTYSHFDREQLVLNGFLALDAIFLGDISVDEVDADVVTLDLLGRWGITPRLQADLQAPFLWRKTRYSTLDDSGVQSIQHEVTMDPSYRLGDVSAGVYYQLVGEGPGHPDVVWNLRVKAPTGEHPYGVDYEVISDPGGGGSLTVPAELPSGNGLWAASTGFSVLKTVDPVILFGSISYDHNFDRDFDDIDSSPDTITPGSIDLGDSIQYGLGTAFAFNESTSMSFSFSQRFTQTSRQRVEGQAWSEVPGSDANIATMNIGMTHAVTRRSTLVWNLGAGLTVDAPDVQLGVKLPIRF